MRRTNPRVKNCGQRIRLAIREPTGDVANDEREDAAPACGRRADAGGRRLPHRVAAEEPLESFEDALKTIRLRREAAHPQQRFERDSAQKEAAAARAIRHARRARAHEQE